MSTSPNAMTLSDAQVRRYARQIVLEEVGGRGQSRLLSASALIVGAGGLGSPAALYLAAAGVGRIGLCDTDEVELTNLHRQVLFGTSDVGRPKVESGRKRLADLNPDVRVETHATKLDADNARAIMRDYDVIVDGTDDLGAKFLLNDTAVALGKPAVMGGILRFAGQVMTVRPGETACYRCLFEEPPPRGLVPACQEAGVLGALAGVIGSLQAVEALRLLLGVGRPPGGTLLIYDALAGTVRQVDVTRRADCGTCAAAPARKE